MEATMLYRVIQGLYRATTFSLLEFLSLSIAGKELIGRMEKKMETIILYRVI